MNDPQYFGGSTVRDGMVRRLNASNFKELTERYINSPVRFGMTRKDFLAHPDRDTLKDGSWLSPCTYPYESEGKRGNHLAEKIALLCIDFDDSEYAKPFVESPDSLREHLHPYNFASWTTAKHTPEAPRLRIVIDIAECDPSLLPRLTAYFAKRLALPPDFKGVTETRTVSQPAYRPLAFKGESDSAVIASRTDGIAFDVAELPTPEEDADEFIKGRTYGCVSLNPDDDSLGLTSLPIAGLTVEDIREPLFAIDPDVGREEWYHVCCALRHQFTSEEEAREAFDLFDEWSSKGTKYKNEKETWYLWNSFLPYAKGRDPVTIRSLFKEAQSAGWVSTKLAKRLTESTSEWIAACEDPDELMNEGPQRVARMPFHNEIVEDSLIISIKDRLKALTGKSFSKVVIAKEVSRERRREKAGKQEEVSTNPPMWLRPMCYVATTNKFHNAGTGVQLSPQAFDNNYAMELMPKDGAEVPANGKPLVSPSDYALNLLKIPRVDQTIYCPLREGEDPFFKIDERSYLNTYNPLSVPRADPERADEAGALFREFLHVIIGNPRYEEIVLDYLASNIQNPGFKILWAVLIQSVEGVGKGFLADILKALMGGSNVRVVLPETLCDKWTDYTTGHALVVLNEVLIPGERKERVSNGLKAAITDAYIDLMAKYEVTREVPNWTNYIAFTNYSNAIHIKPGDRRWFALESPIQSKQQAEALTNSGHFKRMEPLKGELAPALRYWFLQRKIAEDFPFKGPPPSTDFRQSIIDDSTNPVQDAISDLVDSNDPLIGDDVIHYVHLCEILPRHLQAKAAKVSHYLRTMGYVKWRSPERPYINGARTPLWVHRENFVEELGTPMDLLELRLRVKGDLSEI